MIEVCCAFIFCGGRLLAVQRPKHSDHPGQWELPGGKIEPDETAVACIRREIREELGMLIQPHGFLFPVRHDYGIKQVQLFAFIAEIANPELNLQEHQNARWLKAEELFQPNWQQADLELLRLNEKSILNCFGENDDNGREDQRPS